MTEHHGWGAACPPLCGKCGQPLTRENATIRPEYFLHDECLPEELKPDVRKQLQNQLVRGVAAWVSAIQVKIWNHMPEQSLKEIALRNASAEALDVTEEFFNWETVIEMLKELHSEEIAKLG